MKSHFKQLYVSELREKIKSELSLSNVWEVPVFDKIVLNAGARGVAQDSKLINYVFDGLAEISGQLPVKTKARRSISGFKIREGMQIGCKVTLRQEMMYNFLEKLIKIVIPSIRDFRGLVARFDAQGNYNLGVKDWSIFPEMDYDRFPSSHGLNITFHIKKGGEKSSFALLKAFGMPFVVNN